MPVLTLTSYASSGAGLSGAMITDLAIIDPGGGAGPTLYATTGYSGTVTAWDLTTSGPRQINSSAHTRIDTPGTTACLSFISTTQGPAVLTGGGSRGALVVRDLDASGGLGAQQSLGTFPAFAGDLIATITVTLTNGTQVVYGGLAGASGVGRLTFSATGSLTGSSVTADTNASHADRVVALAEASVGGAQYLFTASSVDVGITCWQVSSSGALTARFHLGNASGLWIGTPTAMDVAVVGGQTYLVLAAAGSNTMSLIAVDSGGVMRVTDTVMDDLFSRFAGATALEVVSHGGQTYVIAGGGRRRDQRLSDPAGRAVSGTCASGGHGGDGHFRCQRHRRAKHPDRHRDFRGLLQRDRPDTSHVRSRSVRPDLASRAGWQHADGHIQQ